MLSYRKVKNALPRPNYQDKHIMRNQRTRDIVSELVTSYNLYSDQGEYLTDFFYYTDPLDSARAIHSFLKNNIEYRIEPDNNQTSKSLSRYIHDGYGDCKHYSLAIASILKFLPKYDKICFRFVSYDKNDPNYSHVYVVAHIKNKGWVAIDPLQTFNYEKKFYYKLDKCFTNMALSRLSGVRRPVNLMKFSSSRGNNCGCNGVGNCGCNNVGNIFKKVLAAPARNAYLALVRLNPLNIGGKAKELYNSNPANLKRWWESKFGGSWASLKKAIESVGVMTAEEQAESFAEHGGKRTDERKAYCDSKYPWSLSPFSKRQKCYNGKIDGIGAEPASTGGAAALLIAAAPVLVSLTALVKELKPGSSTDWENSTLINENSGGGGGGSTDIMQFLPLLALGGVAYLIFKK